jgi:predicted DNA repair protein MutK
LATGLIALLDDVAAIAKVAAASLDDIAGHAAKAGAKSAGVVIDDAAVTPRYVVGFAAERELPIVAKIARGSIRNKLLFLLPAALALSVFAPWAITPLLMFGGIFLCYEGAEKVFEALFPHAAHDHEEKTALDPTDPKALEDQKVASAIKTDFILSAEIMAIALATIPDSGLWTQGIVLAIVAVGITAGVYGAVALIVKADDVGVALAANGVKGPFGGLTRALGRGIVKFMPGFLKALAVVGTAAMVWVGGGIIVHGLATYGFTGLEHFIHEIAVAAGHAVPRAAGAVEWLVTAAGSGVVGLAVGALAIPVVGKVIAPVWTALRGGSAGAAG